MSRLPIRNLLQIMATVACLVIVVAGAPSGAAGSDDPGTELVNERIRASLVFEMTDPDAETSEHGRARAFLKVGERGRAVGAAGKTGSGPRDLCMMFVGDSRKGPPEDYFSYGKHMWYADFEALAADMRSIRLAVDWSRYDATGEGRMERARGDRRVLTLEEGERHLLDFVEYEPGPDWHCGRNMTVSVEVEVDEDPALEDELIQYHLVVVPGDGRPRPATFKLAAQGDLVELLLPDVRWPLAEVEFADGSTPEVLGDFSATVRGRVRPDGRIAIDLRAHRWLAIVPPGEDRNGGIGDGGRRVLNVPSGEAIELVMPVPSGSSLNWAEGTSDRDAIERLHALLENPPENWKGYAEDSGQVLVHYPTYFGGTRMSFILTATRVE